MIPESPPLTPLRILCACERSQAVTSRLIEIGHDAWSCDILDCHGPYPDRHLQQDVIPLLSQKWDMIIAFPPCTDLANSGARHFEKKRQDGRQKRAADFFMMFIEADCPRIAVENPIGVMSTMYKKPDQIIQPWHFGDEAQKSTCLWLKGLPELTPTKIVGSGEFIELPGGKRMPKWYNENYHGMRNRKESRSVLFPGIAEAMATQWSWYAQWFNF